MSTLQFTAIGWAARTGQLQAMPMYQTEVPREAVRSDVREAAYKALLACAADLGVSPLPTLRWLPLEREIRGVVHPDDLGVIWVKPQEPDAVVETVAHELKHLQQIRQWGGSPGEAGSFHSMENREAAAREYGLSIRAAYAEGREMKTAQPAAAHLQGDGSTLARAADQQAAKRLWEAKYKPLEEAHNEEVRDRAQRSYRRWR